jgi:hypothetical protein
MERYQFFSDGSVFFVTFSVVDWIPVFVSDKSCGIPAPAIAYVRLATLKGPAVAWNFFSVRASVIVLVESDQHRNERTSGQSDDGTDKHPKAKSVM